MRAMKQTTPMPVQTTTPMPTSTSAGHQGSVSHLNGTLEKVLNCLVREVEGEVEGGQVEGEVGVVMVSERLIREVEGAEVVREVDRNNDYLGCIDHFGCYWTIKVMREEIMKPGSILRAFGVMLELCWSMKLGLCGLLVVVN